MRILGITGGVGCGKSAVLQYLAAQPGIYVMEADKAAHRLEEPGSICFQKIVEYFGEKILDSDGIINRKKLAAIVFADQEALLKLNSIVHPEVKKYILCRIDYIRQYRQYHVFALEAALLLEEHYDEICDEVWYIDASEQTRRRRLKENRGYSDEKITQMMARQLSREQFLEKSSVVIDNNWQLEQTYQQIREELACLNS